MRKINYNVKLSIMTFIMVFVASLFINDAMAIPAFARKYQTSCSTCHYAYPKLNAFGKAFRNNGYRYPMGQDPEMTKEVPVVLGADSYKRVFPDAIWPSDIAGTIPFSAHAVGRIKANGNYDDPTTSTVESKTYTTFEIPHEFELLFGGTIGDKISYMGELEWEHESEFVYEFSVQYDFNPGFHLKLGSVGLNATPEHHRLTAEHYNVVNLKTLSGAWRGRSGAGAGMELWGAVNGAGGKGGFTYAVGFGNGQNDEDNYDLNSKKDVYGRVTYKIGGLGEAGGTEGQASNESAFYLDNSFRIGGFFQSGNALKNDMNDQYSIKGVDIDWWYKRLNFVAVAMSMKSDYDGFERTSLAYFAEANYVLYPWLFAHARYEYTEVDTKVAGNVSTKTFIPALICMLRANVKSSVEYKIPLDEVSKDAKVSGLTLQFNYSF